MINANEASKNNSELAIDGDELVAAMNACVTHAADHYGINITDIANLTGVNKWTLFKWLESGRMPVTELKKFEDICHARFVTRHLADHAGMLLVSRPKGLETPEATLLTANKAMADALSAVSACIGGQIGVKPAIKAIDAAMEVLAVLRRQVDGK